MSKNTELQHKIETTLFTHGDPIHISKLARIVGENKVKVKEALNELTVRLVRKSGLRILKKGEEVQMVTAKKYASIVEKLFYTSKQEELTRASLEVLSIVAYGGPTTRGKIESIRGVNSAYILRALQMRGLIIKKRGEETANYELSFGAMRELGLKDPHDLPEWHAIQEKIEEAENTLNTTA